MKCKFCGCTEDRPCLIPMELAFIHDFPGDWLNGWFDVPEDFVPIPGPDNDPEPCQWLLPDVCTAPLCVEQAYAEAWVLARAA